MNINKINLRLDKNLAYQLDQKSNRTGYTKSNLIRNWIENAGNSLYLEAMGPKTETVNFTLRLDIASYSKLEYLATRFDLSKSSLLRRIIFQNTKPSSGINKSRANYLWEQGRISELNHFLGNNLDQMSLEELIIFINANIHLSEFKIASQALDYIEKQKNQESILVLGHMYKLRAEIEAYERNLRKNKEYLDKALELAILTNDRHLLGITYSEIAKHYMLREEMNKAIEFSLKAIDYLDIENHPVDLTRVYVRLTFIYRYLFKSQENKAIFKKLALLLNNTQNNRFLGCYYAYFANHHMCFNDSKTDHEVSSYYEKSEKFNKISGSQLGLKNLYEFKGASNLSQGNFDTAQLNYSKAAQLEKRRNPKIRISNNQQYLNSIKAKDNYKESISSLETLMKKYPDRHDRDLSKYVLATTRLLFSNTDKEKSRGASELKRISTEGSYPLLQKNAQNTLVTKSFHFV